ncbi:hypothetical protein M0P65_04830 [Candidatus Gracilibacteria bacterium]|nr:hypothetical protein [Candidatus Gracilibacteria bacterium]
MRFKNGIQKLFSKETLTNVSPTNVINTIKTVKERVNYISSIKPKKITLKSLGIMFYLSSLSPEKIIDGLVEMTEEYTDFIKTNPNTSPFISDPYLRKINEITRDHPLNATCPNSQKAIVYEAKSFIGVNGDKKQKSIHELFVGYNFWVAKRLARMLKSANALEEARALKVAMVEKLKQEGNHIKIKFYGKEYELIEHGGRYFDISHIEDPNFFYLKLIIGFSAPKKDAEGIEIIELTPEIIKEYLV